VKSANRTIERIVGEEDEVIGNLLLKNVKHVPSFMKNLASVVEITQTGKELGLPMDSLL
jgi:hypothetical protein